MRMEEYLEKLTDQIRCKLARDPIYEELRCHMEDQKDAYMEEGMDEEEAEAAAVLDMGDPVLTGAEFDRLHRPEMPWKMIVLIMIVSLTGLLVQYLVIGPDSDYVDFRKQLCLLLIGFAVMIAVCFVDYSQIIDKAFAIYLWLHFLALFLPELFGVVTNGSTRWIFIGKSGFSIDQTMLALLFIPLYAAELCRCRGQGYLGLLGITAVVGVCALEVLRIPSLASFLILLATFTVLLHLTVGKGWFKVEKKKVLAVYWGTLAAAGGWIVYHAAPYQQTRLQRLFGIGEGTSYTMELLRKMLRGAKWIGAGTIQGDETLSYADYMLAHIVSRYGVAVGIIIMGGILSLLLLLFRRSLAQKNESGMLIGVSCAMVFLAQVLLYILINLGIISASGYCPFLTYGGSGMIVTFIMLGLLLGVFRFEHVMSLYKTKSPRDYRQDQQAAHLGQKKGYSGVNQAWWQKNAEQIKILLIVFVLFVFLIRNG